MTYLYRQEQKIKLVKDHDGKPLKTPRYGYVVSVMPGESVACGFYTEVGFVNKGLVYLVQTSWSGGALWYTADALRFAQGKHCLKEWREKLARWNQKVGA